MPNTYEREHYGSGPGDCCPEAGVTHCKSLEVSEPENRGPGTYVVTALAADDSVDAISYFFSAEDGVEPPLVVGPQPENEAQFQLGEGLWTLSVSVDDDPDCSDVAKDATCDAALEVCPAEGDTHCTGAQVSGPNCNVPGLCE
jgi:hypothetical protein